MGEKTGGVGGCHNGHGTLDINKRLKIKHRNKTARGKYGGKNRPATYRGDVATGFKKTDNRKNRGGGESKTTRSLNAQSAWGVGEKRPSQKWSIEIQREQYGSRPKERPSNSPG